MQGAASRSESTRPPLLHGRVPEGVMCLPKTDRCCLGHGVPATETKTLFRCCRQGAETEGQILFRVLSVASLLTGARFGRLRTARLSPTPRLPHTPRLVLRPPPLRRGVVGRPAGGRKALVTRARLETVVCKGKSEQTRVGLDEQGPITAGRGCSRSVGRHSALT